MMNTLGLLSGQLPTYCCPTAMHYRQQLYNHHQQQQQQQLPQQPPIPPNLYTSLMMDLHGRHCLICQQTALKRSMASHEPLYSPSDCSSGKLASKCRRIDLNSTSSSHSPGSTYDVTSASSSAAAATQRDEEDSDSGGRKCAGTQTLFSSFVPLMSSSSPPRSSCTSSPDRHRDPYPVDAEPRFILDLDRHMARSSSFFDAPPPFQRPPPAHYIGEVVEMECNNLPLNLSVSSSKTKSTSVADQPSVTSSPGHPHSRNFSSSPRDRWNDSVTREDHERNASSSPRNHRNQSSSPATNHSASSFPVNISNGLRFTGNRNSPGPSVLSGHYAHQSANKHSPWTHEQSSINKHSPWSHEQFLLSKHGGSWTPEQSSLVHGSPWASPKISSSTKWPDSDRLPHHEKGPAQDSAGNSWSNTVKAETSLNGAAGLGCHHNLPPIVRQNMRTFTAWRSVDVGERSPNQSVDRGSEVMSDSPPLNQNCYSLAGDVRQCNLKETRQESESRMSATASGTGECEEGIEEHFQRSLGKDYPKCMNKTGANHHDTNQPTPSSMTSSPAAGVKKNPSSVTGAVDDHFAKSLGATWTKIKCLTDSPPAVQTHRQPGLNGPGQVLSRQLDQRHDSPSRRTDLAWPASGRNQDMSRRIETDSCNDITRHKPRGDSRDQDIDNRRVSSAWSGSAQHQDMSRHHESNVRYESNTRHDSPKRQNPVYRPELSSRRESDKWQESRAPMDSGVGWETGIRTESDNYQRGSVHNGLRIHTQDVRQHPQERGVIRDADLEYNLVKRQEYDGKQRDSSMTNHDLASHVRHEVNMQQSAQRHFDPLQSSRWSKDSRDVQENSDMATASFKQDIKLNQSSRAWDNSLRLRPDQELNQTYPKPDKCTQNDIEVLSNWRLTKPETSNPRGAWEQLSQGRAMRPGSGGKVGSIVRPGSAGSQDGRTWHELGGQKGLMNPQKVEKRNVENNTPKTLLTEANVSSTSSVLPSSNFLRQNSLTLRIENHAADMDIEEERQRDALVPSDGSKNSDMIVHMNKSLQHSSAISSYPSSRLEEDAKSRSNFDSNTEIPSYSNRQQKSVNNLDLSSAVAPLEQHDFSHSRYEAATVSPDTSVRSVPALLRDTVVQPEAVVRPNTSDTEHNSALQASMDRNNIIRTDSVDDHFAKALGDTWLRLKEAKNEKSSISNQSWPEQPALSSAEKNLSN